MANVLTAAAARGREVLFVATGEPDRWIYDSESHAEETLAAGPTRPPGDPPSAGLPHLALEILGIFPWNFGATVAPSSRRGRAFQVGVPRTERPRAAPPV